jgi:uncharacterized membrane protein YhaH (DUF805 family)
MHWLLDPITKHYADFSGRTPRQSYWMFTLLITALYIVIAVAGIVLFDAMLSLVLLFIVVVGLFLPSLAIQVRRLHDIGKSGWWLLLSLIPYIGGFILLVLYCLPSQAGSNKFGANPYGVAASEPVSPTVPEAAPVDTTNTNATT